MSPTDQDLWGAAVDGDAEAFGILFTKYHVTVYNYLFRRTASWEVAEDLLSTTFLEAWRTRRPLSLQDGSALPWLVGVASRLTKQHWRSVNRERSVQARVRTQSPECSPDIAEDVAERFDEERRMAQVLAAIETLPEKHRDVVAACCFAELDYASAAELLGIPVGTVRSRLARARERLLATVGATSSVETEGVPR